MNLTDLEVHTLDPVSAMTQKMDFDSNRNSTSSNSSVFTENSSQDPFFTNETRIDTLYSVQNIETVQRFFRRSYLTFRVYQNAFVNMRSIRDTDLSLTIVETTELSLQIDINPTCSKPISLRFDDYDKNMVTFLRSQYIRIEARIDGLDSCHGMMPDIKYNWAIFNKKDGKPVRMQRMKASGLELVASPSSLTPGIRTGNKNIYMRKNNEGLLEKLWEVGVPTSLVARN